MELILSPGCRPPRPRPLARKPVSAQDLYPFPSHHASRPTWSLLVKAKAAQPQGQLPFSQVSSDFLLTSRFSWVSVSLGSGL